MKNIPLLSARLMVTLGLAATATLGLNACVPLLVAGVTGHLFSTDNELMGAWKPILGLLETGIALSLFYGGFARVSAVLLAWLWIVGVLIFGVEAMLDNALILGFAGFFWLAGRGPISVDRLLFPRLEPSALSMAKAVPILRIGLGISYCNCRKKLNIYFFQAMAICLI